MPSLSAQQVVKQVNDKYGTTVTRQTVARYVEEGMIGESPKKPGPSGWLPEHVYKVLPAESRGILDQTLTSRRRVGGEEATGEVSM